jgi:hypothetical protein
MHDPNVTTTRRLQRLIPCATCNMHVMNILTIHLSSNRSPPADNPPIIQVGHSINKKKLTAFKNPHTASIERLPHLQAISTPR